MTPTNGQLDRFAPVEERYAVIGPTFRDELYRGRREEI
jgi:hypothetical protein